MHMRVCMRVCVSVHVCVNRVPPCGSNYNPVGSHTQGMLATPECVVCTLCRYMHICVHHLMVRILWFVVACVCVFPNQEMLYWYLGISDRHYCYQQLWTNSRTLDSFIQNKSCIRKRGVTSHTNTYHFLGTLMQYCRRWSICICTPNVWRSQVSKIKFQ